MMGIVIVTVNMVGDLITNLEVKINMSWHYFIAWGCLCLGGRHLYNGIYANDRTPQQTKWFQIIIGVIMMVIGFIDLLV